MDNFLPNYLEIGIDENLYQNEPSEIVIEEIKSKFEQNYIPGTTLVLI